MSNFDAVVVGLYNMSLDELITIQEFIRMRIDDLQPRPIVVEKEVSLAHDQDEKELPFFVEPRRDARMSGLGPDFEQKIIIEDFPLTADDYEASLKVAQALQEKENEIAANAMEAVKFQQIEYATADDAQIAQNLAMSTPVPAPVVRVATPAPVVRNTTPVGSQIVRNTTPVGSQIVRNTTPVVPAERKTREAKDPKDMIVEEEDEYPNALSGPEMDYDLERRLKRYLLTQAEEQRKRGNIQGSLTFERQAASCDVNINRLKREIEEKNRPTRNLWGEERQRAQQDFYPMIYEADPAALSSVLLAQKLEAENRASQALIDADREIALRLSQN